MKFYTLFAQMSTVIYSQSYNLYNMICHLKLKVKMTFEDPKTFI